MANRPFHSNRSRRCAAVNCVSGGRITPGQLILEVNHRRYVHVDDIVAAVELMRSAAKSASVFVHQVGAAIAPIMVTMGPALAAARRHQEAAHAAELAQQQRTTR